MQSDRRSSRVWIRYVKLGVPRANLKHSDEGRLLHRFQAQGLKVRGPHDIISKQMDDNGDILHDICDGSLRNWQFQPEALAMNSQQSSDSS